MDFKEELKILFNNYQIDLSIEQCESFEKYYNLLIDWNNKFNLTSITDKSEVILKHFLDSCVTTKMINSNSYIIDIGTGAGFPSIPLKILNPTLRLVLVDSVNKKITFLNEVIKQLNLKDTIALHERIEDLAHKESYREKFDYVVSRAVASLNTLSEYALPFLKINGIFLAYKAFEVENEINNSMRAITLLGGKLESVIIKNFENLNRKIVIIKKVKIISNVYPRNKNKPRTNPL